MHILTVFFSLNFGLCIFWITHTPVYFYYFVVSLSLPGGFHVQLLLIEWSAATATLTATLTATVAAAATATSRHLLPFALFGFSFSFIFYIHNYCGNLFVKQQSVQTMTYICTYIHTNYVSRAPAVFVVFVASSSAAAVPISALRALLLLLLSI